MVVVVEGKSFPMEIALLAVADTIIAMAEAVTEGMFYLHPVEYSSSFKIANLG